MFLFFCCCYYSYFFCSESPEFLDVKIADFNQVMWYLHTTEDKTAVVVSVSFTCWKQLAANGAMDYVKKMYGPLLTPPETGYDLSIKIALKKTDPKEADAIATKASRLARHMFAGVFHAMFSKAAARSGDGKLVQIDYRPNESVWLKQDNDRVIVIFSIFFDDPDDAVIGRVFLTEMGKLVQGAPAVDVYLKDPPTELKGVRNLHAHGYASFLVESRHYAPKQMDLTINQLIQFRNYMHYHIKCSKAYLHIRMRARVNLLLQVLNRAKQEKKPEPKKTFTRKV